MPNGGENEQDVVATIISRYFSFVRTWSNDTVFPEIEPQGLFFKGSYRRRFYFRE
jgi:hypothetical protein